MWVEIPLRDGEKLLVAALYRSPNSSKENDTRLNQFIVEVSHNMTHVLIVGDFNQPLRNDSKDEHWTGRSVNIFVHTKLIKPPSNKKVCIKIQMNKQV